MLYLCHMRVYGGVVSWTYRVRKGGLMRCCLLTLDDAMAELTRNDLAQPAIGDQIRCAHHENYMIRAEDGAWEWNQERSRG